MKEYKHIYFIGIGGIGMSALARYFHSLGKKVAGYDKTPSPVTAALSSTGIDVHFDDNPEVIPDTYRDRESTLVVYTPAVPKAHKELTYFREQHFTVMKRAAVLGEITANSFCFAVAGTHGKTTTSCILTHLLYCAEVPLTAFLGGISEDFGSNYIGSGTDNTVVEADEYDRSFLHLSPDIACVTSMDADHLDIYGDGVSLEKAFEEFVQRVKPGGKVVIRNGLPLTGITYGIDDNSDYCIKNLNIEKGAYVFDLYTPTETLKGVRFNQPGRHNLLNGLAAFAMAELSGPASAVLANSLGTFKGVKRRFSYQIIKDDFVFIDDYAHHPAEIDAVYKAIREMHPNRGITVVFQPHLYSRTRDFGGEFAKSLSQFDRILLLDIYPAREVPIEGITSQWLLDQIENPHKEVVKKEELFAEITKENTDVLVTMGAGDIGLEVSKLKTEFSHAD